MFDLLFKSLSDLNNQTALLEACNWDEDRVEYVLSSFKKEILSSPKFKSGKITIADVKSDISLRLKGHLSKAEILILSNIIDETYLNILKSEQENQYEN
jgi:hypothetical protein